MRKRERAPTKEEAASCADLPRKLSRKTKESKKSRKCIGYSDRPLLSEKIAAAAMAKSLANCGHAVFDADDRGSRIYLGPKQCCGATALNALRMAQVTGIVNCTLDVACAHEEEGIEYCRVSVRDHEAVNINLFFDGATAFIHRHLTRGGAVVVHCQMGISRSATIVIAYLMRYHSFSRDAAYTHVKSRRPQVRVRWARARGGLGYI